MSLRYLKLVRDSITLVLDGYSRGERQLQDRSKTHQSLHGHPRLLVFGTPATKGIQWTMSRGSRNIPLALTPDESTSP